MMPLSPTELATRYALLCRSTRAAPTDDPQELRLAPHLATLRALLVHDLRALGRQGSPDSFADICFELEQEFQRFQEFCAFPALAQKFVVAFGGGFSAGKSSLINALLGKRLLVTEVDPTTSLPTYILQGSEDAIHAQNLFGHHVGLSDEEFLSLTHDEVERYGSNVSRLLRSAIISRKDFPWQHLALIDTPGYTKHEDRQHHERTDEHLARTQLNSAQAIVWVIDARQGCITEDDIAFLTSLQPEIPRLIVLSRADQKPAEDIAAIVAGIRTTLETRSLPFLDVVAVSARKKEWALTPILDQLGRWSKDNRKLPFTHNFKHQLSRYARYLEDERRQAQQHLNRLNRIIALTDQTSIQSDAHELKLRAEGVLQATERLHGNLASLSQTLFAELATIGNHLGIPLREPSELDILDEEGFNLLHALRHRREAEGKAPPDEPATLRELAQPGEMPKLAAILSGEMGQELEEHFAANLDNHCRETYARFLAAIACHDQGSLTATQSALFLKLLEALNLPDMRTTLLAQARHLNTDDFEECHRIVSEHELGNNLFFDALVLCRCRAPFGPSDINLFSEIGAATGLRPVTVAGMPILAGYLLGIHDRTDYTNPEIIELKTWTPLVFRSLSSEETKDGKISGYYIIDKKVNGKRKKNADLSISNALLIFRNKEITFNNSRFENVSIKNSTLINPIIKFSASNILEISNSSILHANENFGDTGSLPSLSGWPLIRCAWFMSSGKINIRNSEVIESKIMLSSKDEIKIENNQLTDSHIHIFSSPQAKINNTKLINIGESSGVNIPQLSLRIESTPFMKIDIEKTSFFTNQGHAILLQGNTRDIKKSLIKINKCFFSNPDTQDFAPIENCITNSGWTGGSPIDLFDESEPINLSIEDSSHNKSSILNKRKTVN